MKLCLLAAAALATGVATASAQQNVTPLSIGETFTMQSAVMGELRRINVYTPAGYADSPATRYPVLYMPDGGIQEDFLHIAGLVQVLTGNGSMRPVVLVGIENTVRRRDMTGPTNSAEDRTIAPVVGGSAAFRSFIRTELMPLIDKRYRTTDESAIVGESLAGLFVLETLFVEPEMFDTYIAFDPSLWWNNAALVENAAAHAAAVTAGRAVYMASSSQADLAILTKQLADTFRARAPATARWHYEPMPEETHATIYHPAAMRAFRHVFKPH